MAHALADLPRLAPAKYFFQPASTIVAGLFVAQSRNPDVVPTSAPCNGKVIFAFSDRRRGLPRNIHPSAGEGRVVSLIDKFIGDAIMAFFGAPVMTDDRLDALRGVRMAVAMLRRLTDLRVKWKHEGFDEVWTMRRCLWNRCLGGCFLDGRSLRRLCNYWQRVGRCPRPGSNKYEGKSAPLAL